MIRCLDALELFATCKAWNWSNHLIHTYHLPWALRLFNSYVRVPVIRYIIALFQPQLVSSWGSGMKELSDSVPLSSIESVSSDCVAQFFCWWSSLDIYSDQLSDLIYCCAEWNVLTFALLRIAASIILTPWSFENFSKRRYDCRDDESTKKWQCCNGLPVRHIDISETPILLHSL